MIFLFLNIFLILFSLIIIYYRLQIATKFKILDHPDNERKIHINPVPLLGGLIIYIFLISSLLYSVYISQISLKLSLILIILYSSFLLIGIYDDKYLLSPLKKTIIIIFLLLIFLPLDSNLIINYLTFKDINEIILLNQGGLFFTLFFLFAKFFPVINMAEVKTVLKDSDSKVYKGRRTIPNSILPVEDRV